MLVIISNCKQSTLQNNILVNFLLFDLRRIPFITIVRIYNEYSQQHSVMEQQKSLIVEREVSVLRNQIHNPIQVKVILLLELSEDLFGDLIQFKARTVNLFWHYFLLNVLARKIYDSMDHQITHFKENKAFIVIETFSYFSFCR